MKPGGRIVYVTCSVLPEEDEDRVSGFLHRRPEFSVTSAASDQALERYLTPEGYLRLTPRSAATDVFFVAVLARAR